MIIRNKNFLVFLTILSFFPFFSNASTLSLSPSSGTYNVGAIFNINILLNTGVEQIDGVDIHYLNYNPAFLEVQNVAPGSLMPVTQTNSIDAVNGKIDFSQVAATGTKYTSSGSSATLATVSFKALSAGTGNVTFSFTSGSTTDTNVASSGVDVLTSVINGSYTLTAPLITNLNFSVSLEADTNPNNNVFNIYVYIAGTSTLIDQYLTKTPVTGKIILSSTAISAGTYDIKLTSQYYLSKKLLNVSLTSNSPVTFPALLSGDLDNNNTINSLDWSIMSPKWNTSDAVADLNKDGIINSIDFSFMNKNWGKTGD